jgi:serine/threonine-protein kinase
MPDELLRDPVHRVELVLTRRGDRTIAMGRVDARTDESLQCIAEALAHARSIDHPGLATCVGVDVHGTIVTASYELPAGRTLQEHARTTRISVSESCAIGARLCEALATAHARRGPGAPTHYGPFHPRTVWLVEADGRAILIGLGLSHARWLLNRSARACGPLLPSIAGCVPEELTGHPYDEKTDSFHVGCLMFQTLAGFEPFHGWHGPDRLRAIANGTPRDLREVRPDVPVALSATISQSLSPEPSKRPDLCTLATVLFSVRAQ